jgi:hypothetical protein
MYVRKERALLGLHWNLEGSLTDDCFTCWVVIRILVIAISGRDIAKFSMKSLIWPRTMSAIVVEWWGRCPFDFKFRLTD